MSTPQNPATRSASPVLLLTWAGALGLGAFQAWRGRFEIIDDCVSYLDVADAYARGNFHAALNGYWSPAYSWVLVPVMRVLRPSLHWEYPAVHLLNFILYGASLWAFDLFVRELIGFTHGDTDGWPLLSPELTRVLGGVLFAWCGLTLLSMTWTGADMLLTLVVTLAFRQLVRVRRRPADTRAWILLGTGLGIAYLTKAIMFPVGLVFLTAACLGRQVPVRTRGLMAALAPFALLVGLFALPLSLSRGRVTYGEAGRLNYAWHVNHVAKAYWQGGPPGNGDPVHVYRRVVLEPPTWVFEQPFEMATYPPWYDASYWYEGMHLRLEAKEILARVERSARPMLAVVRGLHGTVLALVIVAVCGRPPGGRWRRFRRILPFLLPALAALGIYATIRFDARYLAPFLAPALLAFVAASRRSAAPLTSRIAAVLVALVGAALAVHVVGIFRPWSFPRDRFGEVAEGLLRRGGKVGDRVAVLEYGSDDHSPWARLAKMRIVGEVASSDEHPNEIAFWSAAPGERKAVLDAFRAAGVRLVVSREAPPGEPAWLPVGSTGYSVLFLSP